MGKARFIVTHSSLSAPSEFQSTSLTYHVKAREVDIQNPCANISKKKKKGFFIEISESSRYSPRSKLKTLVSL